ncbi:MAG: GxxExxY protein [Candidatus Sungiibacteriota bacterium]
MKKLQHNANDANYMQMPQIVNKGNVIYPELSYRIQGILFKVHNSLGRFRNEKQYADALEEEFKKEGIVFEREKSLPVSFQGEKERRNKIDFLIENEVILEIKAKRIIERQDYFQLKRYLASMNKKLGLLVNFQQKYLAPRRVLNSEV